MSIEEIVLSNIKNVVIEPDFDDDGYCYFNIVIVNDDDSEKYKKYSNLYINYLSKKFNSNPEQVNSHIITKLLSKYSVSETSEATINSEGIDVSVLKIHLQDNKSIEIYLPISYDDEEMIEMLSEFKKSINYESLKNHLLNIIKFNLSKIYNNNVIDNLYFYNSNLRTGCTLFREKITNKKSLYCFTKNLDAIDANDVVVKVAKDFLTKNTDSIDKYKICNGKLTLSFKDGKTFETSNNDLIKTLEPTLHKIEDVLIDKKIKELKLKKKTL